MTEGVTILSQVPSLGSNDVKTFVMGLISAYMRGLKVYITEKAYNTLKPLFEELGVKVKPVQSTQVLPESSSYIVIETRGTFAQVRIYENGKMIHSNAFSIDRFTSALKEVAKMKKGVTEESIGYYEIEIPEDLMLRILSEGPLNGDGGAEA